MCLGSADRPLKGSNGKALSSALYNETGSYCGELNEVLLYYATCIG